MTWTGIQIFNKDIDAIVCGGVQIGLTLAMAIELRVTKGRPMG